MTFTPLPYRRWNVPIVNLQTGELASVTVQSQSRADAAVDSLYAGFRLGWRKTGRAGEPVELPVITGTIEEAIAELENQDQLTQESG